MSSIKSGRILNTILQRNLTKYNSNLNTFYVSVGSNKFPCNSRTIYISSSQSAKVAFKLSDIGEGIREVAVKEWFVKVGDTVKQFDNICEVQSDKASVTITSRYDGVISKLYYKVDDTALVGLPLIDIETDHNDSSIALMSTVEDIQEVSQMVDLNEALKKEPQMNAQSLNSESKPLCIPSVRRLAKEHNIDLSEIRGTGKGNRILKEDILNYLSSAQPVTVTKTVSVRVGSISDDRVENIKGFKKAMVKTMTDALKIPTFVYSDEIIVSKLSNLRSEVKDEFLLKGIKISFMPFFIKAASNALSNFPILNSSVDEKCENIYYKSAHNIAIAMDTKVGLAVPVIKNVQDLTIVEITKELNRLMVAGKEGAFNTSDLSDGTFTISNIGVIGGTYTKPVILPPQVAIIAIGTTKLVPKFDKDMKVVPEQIVSLSGAADHRIVDGATMAHFINDFKKQIENPNMLLLNI